ncbi:MAG: 2-C-methyl-D-erythritol 2,4-cyclodiphosphate synthase [Patescibacteria group bacterium]|nr:2-C-methyl-D-erythritol 2,4-cyclodiphosphate synthase [Patescibacteria group bacterium]
MFKIGLGQDSHAFTAQPKPLVLGGVIIKNAPGLKGNSDCDVILHAICNAFDIAAQKGSIAVYSDPMCLKKGTNNSAQYLKHVQKAAAKKKYKAISASISIEARKPKLEPDSKAIKARLARLLQIPKENIGLTFTSGEGLTSFGQGQGIMATALVVFSKIT